MKIKKVIIKIHMYSLSMALLFLIPAFFLCPRIIGIVCVFIAMFCMGIFLLNLMVSMFFNVELP